MNFFESPYALIIIILGVVLLSVIGICLAVRGMKTATDDSGRDFSNINKLERAFVKAGKLRENRCVLYISISLENYRSLYSDKQTSKVLDDIKRILLDSFSIDEDGGVATQGENNFVSFIMCDQESARDKVESCQSELYKCLLENKAINIAEIRMGAFFAFGSQVSFDEAIKRAKHACVIAKNEKLPYVEWDINSDKGFEQRINIENNIEKEIDNNHFFLEYQPVLDAQTKEIIGAEVPSRLNSETDGILKPRTFLSAVDSVGINNKFDYYIFEKNCKWISNSKKQREGYKYTINFSRSTLCDPMFVDHILGIAEKYDLKFSCLAVEILEDKNITGEARKQMIENLSALKEKGISILLDDFGSGFTTFGDLQNLDISVVKIDRVITQNSVTDTGFIILENIIRTSKDIGFKTLCEGVETKEQEEAVIRAGCDLLQGYYYYRPMPVAMFEELCEKSSLKSKEN